MNGTSELLAVITAADDATTVAIRDNDIRRYSVICSRCPRHRIYSFYYTPADTAADHKRYGDDINLAAAKHAAEHTQPRTATEGDQP